MREKSLFIYPHIAISLLLGGAYFGMLSPFSKEIPLNWLGIDSVIFILSSFILLTALQITIASGMLNSLNNRQRAINIFALGILFIGIGIGLNQLLLNLFSPFYTEIAPFVGIKSVVWGLLYGCAIQIYISIFSQDLHDEEDVEDVEEPDIENKESQEHTVILEKDEEYAPPILERITIKNGTKIEIIPIEQIMQIQANGDYIVIYSTEGKFLKEETMKSIEAQLPKNKFVRVHRSNIVNVDFIAQVEQYGKQSQLLKLNNGIQIRISLNGYKRLKENLKL